MITAARIDALKQARRRRVDQRAARPGDRQTRQPRRDPAVVVRPDRAWPRSPTPDYPDERLVACRNPALAAERARKRAELLDATEAELAKINTAVDAGRLKDSAKIGMRTGRVVNKYKVAKHFEIAIADASFAYQRRQTRSTPRPPRTASTSYAPPASPPSGSPPPKRSPRTNDCGWSRPTSARLRPSTWNCARSTTAANPASARTC